jgi:hypothetical protein
MFRKITRRDNPAVLAKFAGRYETRLKAALRLASARAIRSNQTVRGLFASAKVEGLGSKLDVKAGTVSFTAPPFRGGLHQIYPWQELEDMSVAELAHSISWSLHESLKEKLSGGG